MFKVINENKGFIALVLALVIFGLLIATKGGNMGNSLEPSSTKIALSTTKAKETTTEKETTTQTTTSTTTGTTVFTPAPNNGSGKGKVIYLTFDDGPGQYTDELLRVLDKYNVKATFFVTNAYPKYNYCIAKEAAAGHAIGVHTYTHNYKTIYSSTDAYWDDFNKMNDLIQAQTGHKTNFFRFPGGSSNTVSRRYKTGIMTDLVRQANERGLTYYDWNVQCGDASESGVYNNIINGVQARSTSIVLCHDVKECTVRAMDRTIKWCLDNGYTFETLSPGGFNVHHGVNN